MSFVNSNDHITGRRPLPTPVGGEILAARFVLPMAPADLVANNVGQIGALPAGCVPVDVLVDGTDMDSGAAAMVLQVGLLDAAGTAISAAAADGGGFWGSTVATNTAFHQRLTMSGNAIATVTSNSNADRKVGVRVATAPTTPVAGTLAVTVLYRAA